MGFFELILVTLSAKSSLILGENKAGFRREGHLMKSAFVRRICWLVSSPILA